MYWRRLEIRCPRTGKMLFILAPSFDKEDKPSKDRKEKARLSRKTRTSQSLPDPLDLELMTINLAPTDKDSKGHFSTDQPLVYGMIPDEDLIEVFV